MAETSDIDPADLQRDLDQIKEAMGIAERSKSAIELWLWFGVLVAAASALSQFVVLNRLPAWWHSVIWLGFLVGGGGVLMWWRYGSSWSPGRTEPNVGFQILVVYLGSVVVQLVISPVVPEVGYLLETAYVLGIILVMLGLGYVVAGETLKAYRIRARDRRGFHAGGVLMIVLGVAIPNVDVLHTWGYAVFGASYLIYALTVYAVLTRE